MWNGSVDSLAIDTNFFVLADEAIAYGKSSDANEITIEIEKGMEVQDN